MEKTDTSTFFASFKLNATQNRHKNFLYFSETWVALSAQNLSVHYCPNSTNLRLCFRTRSKALQSKAHWIRIAKVDFEKYPKNIKRKCPLNSTKVISCFQFFKLVRPPLNTKTQLVILDPKTSAYSTRRQRSLTLNDAGFLVSYWGGGGVQNGPLRERGLWMLQFSFKLNKQYLIWKLTYSAKIWDLIEVAEAHTLASGGIGSDWGQNKKK